MALTISDGLRKQLADFIGLLSEHDLEMLEINTKNLTAKLNAAAKKQPNGCSMGRWNDKKGKMPNEVQSDDSNP